MKTVSLLNAPTVYVEIGPDSLKARHGTEQTEAPLERGPDGRLTASGKEKALATLKSFLKTRSWLPRSRAWCAINSRGVSLRRLSIPGGNREEFHQRLLLQIEAEFPLSPDELAWGSQPLGPQKPMNGTLERQDLLVAAVKKEVLADYDELLRACGLEPVFLLTATARRSLVNQPADSFAMLDVGPRQSELTIFENSVPAASRIVFWEGKDAANPSNAEVDTLAQSIKAGLPRTTLYLSGTGLSKDFTERLAWSLGTGCKCERLDLPQSDSRFAALAGMQRLTATNSAPPLVIRMEQASAPAAATTVLDWKTWGQRIGLLLAAALLLPYVEALLLKPHLEKKVADFKVEAERLKVIDREKDFLETLKLSQPPYLDVLYVFSKSVPPGTRFDTLSLNSHGEVSLRCSFHDGQQVADFRNKLITSGFFTNVVVEEQSPTPDHQKVNVRISAQEKGAADLQLASARLTVDEPNKEGKPTMPGMPPTGPSIPSGARKGTK